MAKDSEKKSEEKQKKRAARKASREKLKKELAAQELQDKKDFDRIQQTSKISKRAIKNLFVKNKLEYDNELLDTIFEQMGHKNAGLNKQSLHNFAKKIQRNDITFSEGQLSLGGEDKSYDEVLKTVYDSVKKYQDIFKKYKKEKPTDKFYEYVMKNNEISNEDKVIIASCHANKTELKSFKKQHPYKQFEKEIHENAQDLLRPLVKANNKDGNLALQLVRNNMTAVDFNQLKNFDKQIEGAKSQGFQTGKVFFVKNNKEILEPRAIQAANSSIQEGIRRNAQTGGNEYKTDHQALIKKYAQIQDDYLKNELDKTNKLLDKASKSKDIKQINRLINLKEELKQSIDTRKAFASNSKNQRKVTNLLPQRNLSSMPLEELGPLAKIERAKEIINTLEPNEKRKDSPLKYNKKFIELTRNIDTASELGKYFADLAKMNNKELINESGQIFPPIIDSIKPEDYKGKPMAELLDKSILLNKVVQSDWNTQIVSKEELKNHTNLLEKIENSKLINTDKNLVKFVRTSLDNVYLQEGKKQLAMKIVQDEAKRNNVELEEKYEFSDYCPMQKSQKQEALKKLDSVLDPINKERDSSKLQTAIIALGKVSQNFTKYSNNIVGGTGDLKKSVDNAKEEIEQNKDISSKKKKDVIKKLDDFYNDVNKSHNHIDSMAGARYDNAITSFKESAYKSAVHSMYSEVDQANFITQHFARETSKQIEEQTLNTLVETTAQAVVESVKATGDKDLTTKVENIVGSKVTGPTPIVKVSNLETGLKEISEIKSIPKEVNKVVKDLIKTLQQSKEKLERSEVPIETKDLVAIEQTIQKSAERQFQNNFSIKDKELENLRNNVANINAMDSPNLAEARNNMIAAIDEYSKGERNQQDTKNLGEEVNKLSQKINGELGKGDLLEQEASQKLKDLIRPLESIKELCDKEVDAEQLKSDIESQKFTPEKYKEANEKLREVKLNFQNTLSSLQEIETTPRSADLPTSQINQLDSLIKAGKDIENKGRISQLVEEFVKDTTPENGKKLISELSEVENKVPKEFKDDTKKLAAEIEKNVIEHVKDKIVEENKKRYEDLQKELSSIDKEMQKNPQDLTLKQKDALIANANELITEMSKVVKLAGTKARDVESVEKFRDNLQEFNKGTENRRQELEQLENKHKRTSISHELRKKASNLGQKMESSQKLKQSVNSPEKATQQVDNKKATNKNFRLGQHRASNAR